jgi:AcrR family transcriptional regulator
MRHFLSTAFDVLRSGNTVGEPSRRESNKASKRARLEEAALEEFLRHGYVGASIERIAASAGVARGTFYLYFSDKRVLFTALADAVLEPILTATEVARSELTRCIDLEATGPVYGKLAAEVGATVLRHPGAARLVLCEARAAGPGGDVVRVRVRRLEEAAARILADGVASGLFRPHDVDGVALAIVGAIERLAWAALSGDDRLDPVALSAEVVLLFRHGLAG